MIDPESHLCARPPRAVRFDDGQVYVPEGCAPNEQRPVILVRTAYSRHLISFPAQRFAERGYLVYPGTPTTTPHTLALHPTPYTPHTLYTLYTPHPNLRP